eukprot:1795079-Alexandrium_andersonii.AAC.1
MHQKAVGTTREPWTAGRKHQEGLAGKIELWEALGGATERQESWEAQVGDRREMMAWVVRLQ